MPSAIYAGQGTILKITITATLTAIAQVVEIDGPSIEIGNKEITNLSDTVKKYRALLPDGGEITATIQYDHTDASHAFLETASMTWPQPAVACELDFGVTTHKATFSAFVTEFHLKGFNQEDNIEADIKLKITGAVTFA